MKQILLLITIFFLQNAKAQTDAWDVLLKAPSLTKKESLTKVNDKPSFNLSKWHNVKDKNVWAHLFGITEGKDANGKAVSEVRIFKAWGITEAHTAYVYAYNTSENGKIKTNIFLTTFGKDGKTIDNNPFEVVANPTGMKGKITVTKTFSLTAFGVITAKSIHKSSNGKVLSKTRECTITETGQLVDSE